MSPVVAFRSSLHFGGFCADPNSGPIDCSQDNTLTQSLHAAAFVQRKAVQESVRSSPSLGVQGHLYSLSPNAPALLLLARGAGIHHAGTIHCGMWSMTPWWAVPVYFLQLTSSRHTLVRTPLLPPAGGNGATETHDHHRGSQAAYFSTAQSISPTHQTTVSQTPRLTWDHGGASGKAAHKSAGRSLSEGLCRLPSSRKPPPPAALCTQRLDLEPLFVSKP